MDTEITKRVYRQIKQDMARDVLIRALDAIDHLEWKLPAGINKQKWARLDVDTSGHDALKAATNVFAAFLPKWDVVPRGPDDNISAEQYERWLEYCYMRMNDRGESTVTWDVMKSATKFDMVFARVDYLPYYIVGDEPTKRQKLALRKGPFATKVYHPLHIHYTMGPWGQEWVAEFAIYEAEDVLGHWSVFANPDDQEKGGKTVSAAMKKIKAYIKEQGPQKKARLAVLDYNDLDRRYVKAVKTEQDVADPDLLLADEKDTILILDVENELPFNMWVVSVGGTGFEKGEFKIDPLLAPLHRANLWSNQNLHESLQTTKVLKRFGFPDMLIYTATGEKKRVDFSGETNVLPLKTGQESAEAVNAPQLDPGLREIVDRGRARITSTTGVKVLQNLDITGNLQYATVQALLQMALGQLTPPKNVAEKCLSQIGERMLEWIAFTGDTINAFYLADYGKVKSRKRGAQVSISPDEIDLESMTIKCKLMANTPMDRNQRVNMAVMEHEKLGVPLNELAEELGHGAPEILENEYLKEQIFQATLQSYIETMRAAAMQKVAPPQAPPSAKGVPSPSQENVAGEGYNQAVGGASPLTADRDLTREGITGQAITGQERPGMP